MEIIGPGSETYSQSAPPAAQPPVRKVAAVHVGFDAQPTAAQQTAGLACEAPPSDAELASRYPTLSCPCCGGLASGLSGGGDHYTMKRRNTLGRLVTVALPPCPVGGFGPLTSYDCSPCGCRVSSFFASSLVAELARRARGEAPRPLAKPSAADVASQTRHFSVLLARLSLMASACTDAASREAAETWMVVAADQLMRINPTTANRKLPEISSPFVREWAEGLLPPREEETLTLTMTVSARGPVTFNFSDGRVRTFPDSAAAKEFAEQMMAADPSASAVFAQAKVVSAAEDLTDVLPARKAGNVEKRPRPRRKIRYSDHNPDD